MTRSVASIGGSHQLDGLKVSIYAHDAGGASVLKALCRHVSADEIWVHVAGPAVATFSRKHLAFSRCMGHCSCTPDLVVTGTSWKSRHEYDAWTSARRAGVPSVGVLDHWSNFKDRFVREGLEILPDELWVTDDWALDIASGNWPETPVRLIPAHYRDDLAQLVRKMREVGPPSEESREYVRVLLLGETLRATQMESADRFWRYFPDESDMLIRVLRTIRSAGRDVRLRIRPHPSQDTTPYEVGAHTLGESVLNFSPPGTSLAGDIAWADICVGTSTMAMVHALDSGVPTFQAFPRSDIRSPLPMTFAVFTASSICKFLDVES